MPKWSRWPLRLPYLPVAEETMVRAAGRAVTTGIRWATTAPSQAAGAQAYEPPTADRSATG
jgi:hypothetical protein